MSGLLMAFHPSCWRPVARSFAQARTANKLRRIIRLGLISRRFSPHPFFVQPRRRR